jgi:Skp family chaperone for outer membrane proteins
MRCSATRRLEKSDEHFAKKRKAFCKKVQSILQKSAKRFAKKCKAFCKKVQNALQNVAASV